MLFTLWFFYAPVMLGALVGNFVACLLVFRRRRETRWRLRYAYYLSALVMLPGLAFDAGGMSPENASLLWGAWLYPAAFFLAAGANLGWLRRAGWRWWLVPVPALNAWLGLVFLTRWLSYLGVPLGIAVDGAHVAYSMMQSGTANLLYIFFPIFNLLPVLLLPAGPAQKWLRRVNVLPAAACLVLFALNVALLPFGYRVAASWQAPVPAPDAPPGRSDFRPGVVLRVSSDPLPTEDRFAEELARLEDLGARAVNLFLHDDLMRDRARADAVGRFLDELRRRGVTTILTADYPQRWATRPPSGPDEVLATMGPFQQFLAKRYRPEILVPFIEPYGAFIVLGRATYPPEQWEQLLAVATQGVHEAAPGVRCAVYLGSLENDEALYRRVCREGSPVDVVGFSFYSLYQTRKDMEAVLAKVGGWIQESGRGREHWVFEFGQSPVTMGGERSQSHYLQCVTGWAMRRPEMRGVCVFALGDYAEKLGLVNSLGRKRRAYYDYQELLRAIPRQRNAGGRE